MTEILRIFLLSALFGSLALAQNARACPAGQHEVCVMGTCTCLPAAGAAKDAPETSEIGKVIEKSAPDTRTRDADTRTRDAVAIKKDGSLTPVREYLRAKNIPPPEAGAYGIVVFHSKPTPANKAKLMMVCNSFVAFFPRSATSGVPMSDRMITIWPLDDPDALEAKADDCDFILNHYDLNASESAINDARIQHASFDGEGPYLVGWSPSNSRGVPDKLVLVVDMSNDNSQAMIDQKFMFWKNKIIEDPSLWRNGWSLEGVRMAIKEFSDKYGNDMLSAIKLVRGTEP